MENQAYEIIIKEQARLDVLNQYLFFAEEYSVQYAETFLSGFIEQVENILPFVWAFPECRFLPTKNHIYRNIVWENHLIIYKIVKFEIWVVGVFYAKQNPKKLKQYKRVK